MSKNDHISKPDNFLQNILELRQLVSKILSAQEELKKDFARLQEIITSISREIRK